jgi:hypothetical protein
MAYARIVYLKARPAGSRVTYDAQRNGYASGEWEVYLPEGSFTARFALDQPWVNRISEGSQVRVLVHPRRKQVLVPLGP